jgi:hypothetical protein
MGYETLSREALEGEIDRCNGIMASDGLRIGLLTRDNEALIKAASELIEVLRAMPMGAQHPQLVELVRAVDVAKSAGGYVPNLNEKSLFYAVSGRVCGADEDSTLCIVATSEEEAKEIFMKSMCEEESAEDLEAAFSEHGTCVFIESIVASRTPFVGEALITAADVSHIQGFVGDVTEAGHRAKLLAIFASREGVLIDLSPVPDEETGKFRVSLTDDIEGTGIDDILFDSEQEGIEFIDECLALQEKRQGEGAEKGVCP